jgi:energy-coupling factor transporter transmembrane protein EcfT
MTSACYFIYLEFYKIGLLGKEYIKETWNFFDFLGFIFILVHFVLRLTTLQDEFNIIHDQDDDHDKFVEGSSTQSLIILKILSVLILVQSFMEVMSYLRVNAEFGLLVKLVGQCISDVQ